MKQLPIPDLRKKCNALHAECLEAAFTTRDKAVKLGQLLIQIKASLPSGEWTGFCETLDYSRTTVFRYIKVAEHYSDKTNRLDQGKELIDLYRSLGLVDETEGGGYRSEDYQRRKLLKAQGHQLFFEFEHVDPIFKAIEQSSEALKRGAMKRDKLAALKDRMVSALQVIDDALAGISEEGAIPV